MLSANNIQSSVCQVSDNNALFTVPKNVELRNYKSRYKDTIDFVVSFKDDGQMQEKYAEQLNVDQSTVSRLLKAIGKILKFGRWVPRELTDRQQKKGCSPDTKESRFCIDSSLVMKNGYISRILNATEQIGHKAKSLRKENNALSFLGSE